jgi:hypothetical protein
MSVDQFLEGFGLKSTSLVAGVFGAVASLTYERNISPMRAVFLILVGAAAAGYLTPWLAEYMKVDGATANAYAFLIGLLSMRIIGAILSIGEKIKKDPVTFLKNLKGNNGTPG